MLPILLLASTSPALIAWEVGVVVLEVAFETLLKSDRIVAVFDAAAARLPADVI